MPNGADRLTDTLLANGVDTCFANPGTSEMHFVAALDRKPELRCVLGLFEGVVSAAADGYARMTDKPAATLLHCGPGLANALANLHNARRANTPMVNIVGDHASHHLSYDAPLASDIESLARPMSHWVGRAEGPHDIAEKAGEAYAAAMTAPGVATLILPADTAWGEATAPLPAPVELPAPPPVEESALREAVAALKAGDAALFLGGKAARADALHLAGQIAAATGARLYTDRTPRIERGAGRVPTQRVPYNVDLAVRTLSGTRSAILIGCGAPVAFFAYPGKPSSLLPDDCTVVDLADHQHDLLATLDALVDALGARSLTPTVGAFTARDLPAPEGALDIAAVTQTLARAVPEGAIICDEAVSLSAHVGAHGPTMAPHDHLILTGGSIGIGIPLSVGASVGAPGRRVVNIQADGSGMYTVQALWTEARENLPILTIILANRGYAILRGEMRNVGVNDFGPNAQRMLDVDNPTLDWVSMAKGMGVEAARAETAEDFARLVEAGLTHNGPFLIEAVL